MGRGNSNPRGAPVRVSRKKSRKAVRPGSEIPPPAAGSESTIPSAAGKSILIVDDDPTTQHIIRHFLEKDGFAVDSAEDPREGLRQAREKPPSLIVLDLMLPGMSGFSVLACLKQEAACASVPVIVISSLTQEDNILKALAAGAVDYMTKPLSPVVLVAKIKRLLNVRL